MNKQDKLLEIFLIESSEIIENLELQILDLEEQLSNKDLINDIFRGIHTLKGNSNSFGFTNVGGIVHYFEDLLDIYRNEDNKLNEEVMELIIQVYDLIKEVFELEKSGKKEVPKNYEELVSKIKSYLTPKEETKEIKEVKNLIIEEDFYGPKDYEELERLSKEEIKEMKEEIKRGFHIININMLFDDQNFYFTTLFKDIAKIKKTFIYCEVDPEGYDFEKNYVKRTSLYLAIKCEMEEIEEVFDLKDEEEIVYINIITEEELNGKRNLFEKEPQYEIFEQEQKDKSLENKVLEEDNLNNKEIKEENIIKEVKKQSTSIRIDSHKIDELFDTIGELVITQSFIIENDKIAELNDAEITKHLNLLKKATKLIQNKVMNIRMIPIKDTFMKMKRVVRDVCKKTNKEVDFHLMGEDTEIDKTMIENLSEPLIHLIRNSIDHGIESEEERKKNNKEPKGNVWLKAEHRGNNFIIEIKDDGKGINTEYILKKAIDKKIAKENEEYTKEQILQFLFEPGFSTAETITDVSGRGVGLDSVKQNILNMKGKIEIETKEGEGSKFKIVLPLTLAIIDGMVVLVEKKKYIIPTLNVIEAFRPKIDQIKTIKEKGECINYRGEILPIFSLKDILELGEKEEKIKYTNSTCICIENEKGKYVLLVEELLGRQQIVIKSLSKMFRDLKEISGATILGNGEVALIINTEGIREYIDKEVE